MLGAKLAQYSMAIVDLAIRSIPVPFAWLNFSLRFFGSKCPAVPFIFVPFFAFDRLVGIQPYVANMANAVASIIVRIRTHRSGGRESQNATLHGNF